jgi:hypothetical protein
MFVRNVVHLHRRLLLGCVTLQDYSALCRLTVVFGSCLPSNTTRQFIVGMCDPAGLFCFMWTDRRVW